jgi:hypothetical protein
MAEKLTVKKLVGILKKVPEKRFRIIELAPELVDADGKVDMEKAIGMQGELNLAITEVQSYIRGNRDLIRSLEWVQGQTQREPYDEDDDDPLMGGDIEIGEDDLEDDR